MAHLEKLKQLYQRGEYVQLQAFCKEKLEFNPGDPDLLFYYAVSLEAQKKYGAAKNAFEKLYRITNDLVFRICESIPEYKEGNTKNAGKMLRWAVDKENENVENLFFAFRVAVESGETKTAQKTLAKAIAIDPAKTREFIQGYFEKTGDLGMERKLLLIALLDFLRTMEK